MSSPVVFDNRAVSPVIGFILIFGIIVMMMATYQAVVVPSNNAAIEFDHNQHVQDDMLAVRNSILTAKITGQDSFATVKLGVEFPDRTFALNPSNPTGTLRTTSPEPFEIRRNGPTGTVITESVCGATSFLGEEVAVNETRLLEYRPSYREYGGAGTIRYEHTMLYHEFSTANIFRPLGEPAQKMIRGDRITIVPLDSEFNAEGSQLVSFEPEPGFLAEERVSNPYIELPTKLTSEDVATVESSIERRLTEGKTLESIAIEDGRLKLHFDGQFTLRCSPVGIGETPETGARDAFPVPGEEIHPDVVSNVRFDGADDDGPARVVNLHFTNLGEEDVEIVGARINFYRGDQTYVDITSPATGPRLYIGDSMAILDQPILVPANDQQSFSMRFSDPVGGQQWFMMTLQFDDGRNAQFFVTW